MTTLGLIGYGAIARDIVSAFSADAVDWVVLLREDATPELPANLSAVTRLDLLIETHPEAVVEAAGQEAVAAYVPALLEAGIPTVIASVGALADTALYTRITVAGRNGGAPFILPAGALGGLDYLRAIAALPDARVRYTSRKPPAAWKAELAALGLSAEHDAVTLFEGSPVAAAAAYPKNLNAAFAVALAVGTDKVTVRAIADPKAAGNTHEIEAESAAGTASFHLANAPSPGNPKTSALTALSLVAALRDLLTAGGRH